MTKKSTIRRNAVNTALVAAHMFFGGPVVSDRAEFTLQEKLQNARVEYARQEAMRDSIEYARQESLSDSVLSREYFKGLVQKIYSESTDMSSYITEEYTLNVIKVESGYRPFAVSDAGAAGPMQLMQNTWNEFEKNLNYDEYKFDPEANVRVGIKYNKWIDRVCRNNHPDWDKLSDNEKRNFISAAFHGGITSLMKKKWDIEKMSERTQRYVRAVNQD